MGRNRESVERELAPEPAPQPSPPAPLAAEQLLALQRSAGNAAVARAIGDAPATPAGQRRRIAIPPGKRRPPGAPSAALPQTPADQRRPMPIAPGRAAPPAPPGALVLVPAPVLDQAAANAAGDVAEVPAEDVYAYEEHGAAPDLVVAVDADRAPVPEGSYLEVGEDAPEQQDEDSPYVPRQGGGEDDWGDDAEVDWDADGASPYRNIVASMEEVEEAVGPEVLAQALVGGEAPPHALIQQGAERPNRIRPRKYRAIPINESRKKYRGEDKSSRQFILEHVFTEAAKQAKSTGAPMPEVLKTTFGWTDADVMNHLGTGAANAKVDYLDEARREDFELHLGGKITQGRDNRTFDTAPMFSKFLGKGYGIYVMDDSGAFYADAHRVGLFHHSSFVHGGDVAGAGELKVDDGALEHISNKSGHYQPGREEMMQVLDELIAQGVSLAGVGITIVEKGQLNDALGAETTFDGNAQQFYNHEKSSAPR